MTNTLFSREILRDDSISSSFADSESEISEIDLAHRRRERLVVRGVVLTAFGKAYHAIARAVNLGASSSVRTSEVRKKVQKQDGLLGYRNNSGSSRTLKKSVSSSVVKIETSTSEVAKEVQNEDDPSKEWRKSRMLRNNPPLLNFLNHVGAELVAAGWPSWLAAVAGEALMGWVPRRADTFERFDKIGQGVYKGRDTLTGKIVALKKVRFETSEPETVKLMAREILILRRLDHPNVMKLEGLVTSKMCASLYLVFEYMEGLPADPQTKFTEPQVKCYMHQLLLGLEHCHNHGVLHRDIKCSNLLLDNEGVLKIAAFGLASFFDPQYKQPMTSGVVSLWYRSPELLLGATDYGVAVDLWSAGCVLAELIAGRPIMSGQTEVEQLHKIFKLCGSPSEKYWEKSKLPHATVFKPDQPYIRCVAVAFQDFPPSSLTLIETLLAIDPSERQTATAALRSEFFSTKPYRCEPSSLPQYPPSKNMDAEVHAEEAKRNSAVGITNAVDPLGRREARRHHAIKESDPTQSTNEKFQSSHQDGSLAVTSNILGHIDPSTALDNAILIHEEVIASVLSGPLLNNVANDVHRRLLAANTVAVPETIVELQLNLEESHLTKSATEELPSSHQGGSRRVEDDQTDCKTHKVIVKGEKADPLKILDRVQRKSHRKVELLSALPKPPPEKETNENIKPEEEKKKEEEVIITVVLKVHMHCEAFAQEIEIRIKRMEGVKTAEADLKNSQVTVQGMFDPLKLVEYVYNNTSQHAMIIKTEPEKKEEEKAKEETAEKKEEHAKEDVEKKEAEEAKSVEEEAKKPKGGEATNRGGGGFFTNAVLMEPLKNESYGFSLQMFSDENPNACSIL